MFRCTKIKLNLVPRAFPTFKGKALGTRLDKTGFFLLRLGPSVTIIESSLRPRESRLGCHDLTAILHILILTIKKTFLDHLKLLS